MQTEFQKRTVELSGSNSGTAHFEFPTHIIKADAVISGFQLEGIPTGEHSIRLDTNISATTVTVTATMHGYPSNRY